MKSTVNDFVQKLHRDKARNRRAFAIVMMLSLMVTFGVVWGLHGVGISMANDVDCGKEEHQHSDSCYQKNMICNMQEGDFVIEDGVSSYHTHSDACFEKTLICQIPEHIHTVACMDVDITDDKGAANVSTDGGSDIVDEDAPTNTKLTGDDSDNDGILDNGSALPSTEVKLGEFYVVTKLGDRHKHKIREYLARATPVDNNIEECKAHIKDGYVENYYYGSGYGQSCQYMLYPGYKFVAAVYVRTNRDHFTEDDFSLPVNANDYITLKNVQTEALADDPTIKRVTVEVHTQTYKKNEDGVEDPSLGMIDTAGRAELKFGDDSFYIYTQQRAMTEEDIMGRRLTHSDIEITDGGTYEITTIINYPGTDTKPAYSEKIVTKYESFVADVESCKIYDNVNATGTPIKTYTKDYYVHAEIEGQSTQYEVTSRDIGAQDDRKDMIDAEKVEAVLFDIDMNLYPISATKTTYAAPNAGGSQIGGVEPYRVDESDQVIIKHALFKLTGQSIVDALNKCPNTSGFDFNVVSKQINININPPLTPEFKIQKGFDNITDKVFEFEIYDENESPEKLLKTLKTEPGQFPGNQLLTYILDDTNAICAPGKYTYLIKEKVPDGATYITTNTYYKDGVIYDARPIEVTYTVELDGDLSALYSTPDNVIYADMQLKITNTEYSCLHSPISMPGEAIEYNNVSAEYANTDLTLNKIWSDGNANHTSDRLFFKVIAKCNGEEIPLPNYDSNIFSLPNNGNWSMTLTHLPKTNQNGIYTYEVEEIPLLGYTPSVEYDESNSGNIICNVTNTPSNHAELSVKKKWVDTDGVTPLSDDKIPTNAVSGLVTRKYKDATTPVMILLRDPEYPKGHVYSGFTPSPEPGQYPVLDNGAGIKEIFTYDTYVNADSSSFIKDKNGNDLEVTIIEDGVANATAQINDRRIDVHDVQAGARIVLDYPEADESVFMLHQTNGADFSGWKFDGHLNDCYGTCHSFAEGRNSIQVYNRTADWSVPRCDFDLNTFRPGETYTIGGYVRATGLYSEVANGATKEIVSEDYNVSIKMIYWRANELDEDGNGKGLGNWVSVASGAARKDEWVHISGNFKVPSDAAKAVLIITTDGESGKATDGSLNCYTDLFFDDIYVTEKDKDYAINARGEIHVLTETSLVNVYNQPSANTVTDWRDEGTPNQSENGWPKTVTLTKGNNWMQTFDKDQLNQDPTRIYQYDVVETTYLETFTTSYNNTNVAENDEDHPMEIINRYAAYVLPNTGGAGTRHIQVIGMTLLVGAAFSILYRIKRKRRAGG